MLSSEKFEPEIPEELPAMVVPYCDHDFKGDETETIKRRILVRIMIFPKQ